MQNSRSAFQKKMHPCKIWQVLSITPTYSACIKERFSSFVSSVHFSKSWPWFRVHSVPSSSFTVLYNSLMLNLVFIKGIIIFFNTVVQVGICIKFLPTAAPMSPSHYCEAYCLPLQWPFLSPSNTWLPFHNAQIEWSRWTVQPYTNNKMFLFIQHTCAGI